MKFRMELSCSYGKVTDALFEVHAMLQNTDIQSVQMKVVLGTAGEKFGNTEHVWCDIRKAGSPNDQIRIFELEMRIRELTYRGDNP